jgi:hypothetical protein
MPHEIMDYAVTACKAAQICQLRGRVPDDLSLLYDDARNAFLDDHPQGRNSQSFTLCKKGLLLSLYRLWWVADHFIELYVREAFDNARRNIPGLKDCPDRELSSFEQGRLQRSFYIFETYRRLFMGTPTYPPHGQDTLDFFSCPLERFLESLRPSERERLRSVHEFLCKFGQDLLDKTRGYIVREVSEIAFASAAKPDTTPVTVDPLLGLGLDL